jgi:transcription antitermination factor NusG
MSLLISQPAQSPALAEFVEARWYAIHTCSRHEKQVATHLERRAVEFFLPTYPSVRRWKDRRVCLDLPLFPGYLFVRIPLAERLRVLQVPSVVSLIGVNGRGTPLADDEVDQVRNAVAGGRGVEPHAYLRIGQRVRVRSGPLCELEGILVRKKNGLRVVISLDLIMRSMAVEVDASEIEPVTEAARRRARPLSARSRCIL